MQADVKNHEYERILGALGAHNGRRSAAAKALGISPRTLRYKIARMREEGVDLDATSNQVMHG